MSHNLDNNIGALAVGHIAHDPGAILLRVEFIDVDDDVGAERMREFESFGYPVNGDDASGAAGFCHRNRIKSQRTGALDDDVFPELKVNAFESVHDLGKCAVRAGCNLVRDGIGNGVGDCTCGKREVIAVAAYEIRRLVGIPQHRHPEIQAGVASARQTVPAGVAGKEVGEHDPGAVM